MYIEQESELFKYFVMYFIVYKAHSCPLPHLDV